MLLVNIYFMLQILQKLDGMSNQINKLNNTGCNRIMPDNLKITHVYISSVDCVCSYHLSISMQFHNMGASTDAPLQYPPWCCARSSPPFNQKTAKHTLWYAQIRNTRDEIFTSMLQLQIAMRVLVKQCRQVLMDYLCYGRTRLPRAQNAQKPPGRPLNTRTRTTLRKKRPTWLARRSAINDGEN